MAGEQYFLLTPGASDTGINVFVWTDGKTPQGQSTGTSDGIVDNTELSLVAKLAGGDTSNVSELNLHFSQFLVLVFKY